jgi:hypothetical protein
VQFSGYPGPEEGSSLSAVAMRHGVTQTSPDQQAPVPAPAPAPAPVPAPAPAQAPAEAQAVVVEGEDELEMSKRQIAKLRKSIRAVKLGAEQDEVLSFAQPQPLLFPPVQRFSLFRHSVLFL